MARKRFRASEWFRRVGYQPHPGQVPIHASRARYRVAVCGRRWGKSARLAAHECELYLAAPVPSRVWVVAPTYEHTVKVFRAVYHHLVQGVWRGKPVVDGYRQSPNPRLKLVWGAVLEGKSADHPASLVGEGLDFLVVDEAAKIAERRIWEQYLQPTLADRHGRALFITTPEGFNWVYELYARGQGADPDWASWRSPTWVNTAAFPGGSTDPEIELARRTLSSEYFRQEYGAEFTALTGRVYKEFDRQTHVLDGLPAGHDAWVRYRSIDFGYVNPFCCVWVAADTDGRWYVYDEHYRCGTYYQDQADAIRQRGTTGFARTVADPADPQGIDQLGRFGVLCEKARTAKSAGIELVRERLKVQGDGRPRLYVLRRCAHTIFEFENYRYPHDGGGSPSTEQPLKKDDHAMDCLKNLALTLASQGRWQQVR